MKTALSTPYGLYTSPLTSLSIGATAIDSKLSKENNYLNDQRKYLQNNILGEGISSSLPNKLDSVKPIINSLTNEYLNGLEK